MKPKAYSYIRMSTDIQIRGDSLRRQSEASKKYALDHDLDLVEDFKLEDIGVSAFHGKNIAHGSLGRFLALVEDRRIPQGSYLLVESLDRISRQNPQAATTLFLQILQAGVNIVTLTDNHVYRTGSADFTDIIVSVVIMSRAYEESKTKSVRVGAAWANKRQNAAEKKLTQICPGWLMLDGDRRSFQLVPERAAVVQSIFTQSAAGIGSYQIARKLTETGVPTFKQAIGWHESMIAKTLTNRSVLGEYQPHRLINGKRVPDGKPIADYFPRIISDETFALVQSGRAARKNRGAGRKGRNNINLFSGVAECGYCGSKMRVIDKGAKPKGGIYLCCGAAYIKAGCRASFWPLDQLETTFLHFVKELDLASLIGERRFLHEVRETLEAKLAALETEISKKQRMRDQAFQLLSEDGIEAGYVRGKIADLTHEISNFEKQCAALASELSQDRASAENTVEIEELIRSLSVRSSDNADDRTRVADWLRRNVLSMRIYPDGLDGPPGTLQEMRDALPTDAAAVLEKAVSFAAKRGALVEGGHRRFETAFGPLASRIVEVDRSDPLKFVVSMRINELEAVLETPENEVTRLTLGSTFEDQIGVDESA